MSCIDDFTILQTMHENTIQNSKILLATLNDIPTPKYIIRAIDNQRIQDLELKIHTTLKHRKLIKYITHFKDKEFTYIVLEHAPIDLLDYVQTHTLTTPQIAYIVRQVLEVIHYLHHNNIAHMDIKPENIVIFPNYKIKLIDFGFAKEFNTKLKTPLGTLEYFSPEMTKLNDEKIDSITVSGNTDIWCIGCFTYELTFNKPVPRKNISDHINKLNHPNKHLTDFLNQTLLKQTPIKQLLTHSFITHYS